jgi:hypothetical protein
MRIDQGWDFVIGADLQKLRFELIALPNVDSMGLPIFA